jgi:hypothetical protein
VAQEALRNPPPRSHPHLDALGAYWNLAYDLLERAGGVPRHAVDGLAGSAREAGLDVVAVDGSFGIIDPELGFDLHAATLLAARERAVASGIAAGQQIDDLANDLRAAKGGGYEWVSMPFFLDLTLRKPLAARGLMAPGVSRDRLRLYTLMGPETRSVKAITTKRPVQDLWGRTGFELVTSSGVG